MLNTDKELRKVALSITHYAYRNTKLEDYHANCVTMDNEFYKKIYLIVYSKLNNVQQLHKYILKCPADCNSQEEFDNFFKTIPENLQLKFVRYFKEIVWGLNFGSHWEEAQICEHSKLDTNAATYVLGGRFKECCNNHCRLDDETMCYINKDVHNRIYTLLIDGYFS